MFPVFKVHELDFIKIESSGKKMRARLQAAEPVAGEFVTPPHAVRFGKARVAPGHCLLVSGGRCSSLVSPYTKAEAGLQDTREMSVSSPLSHVPSFCRLCPPPMCLSWKV